MRLAAASLAASLALAGTAVAQTPAPAFGPIQLAMTLDEVRAATPGVTWDVLSRAQHSRTPTAIGAKRAVTIDGRTYDVRAHAERYARRFEFKAPVEAADAGACEMAALAWIAGLAPTLGPLRGGDPRVIPRQPPPLNWSISRGPGGVISVVPVPGAGSPSEPEGELVRIDDGSDALVTASGPNARPISRARFSRTPPAMMRVSARKDRTSDNGDISITAVADYLRLDPHRACELTLVLTQTQPAPAPSPYPIDPPVIVSAATIAFRHAETSRLQNLPPGGVTVPLDCRVQRDDGAVQSCRFVEPGPTDQALRRLALAYGYATRLDMSSVADRDDPQDMTIRLPVRIDPADRRPIDFLEAPRTSLGQLRVVRQPNAADLYRAYPREALEKAITADVTVTCQIQSDGSVICANPRTPADAAKVALFGEAALKATQSLLLAPQLADGSPSAGAVFDLNIAFRLAE